MKCAEFRESLSSRLDGETHMPADAVLDRHVHGCPVCRLWQERAAQLRRAMLVREAPRVPDLTERILDNVAAPATERWALRVALAAIALSQSGLGFAQLIMPDTGHIGHSGMVTATHLGNESAAWNIAVGIGLLWAALRPRTAAGLVPAFTGFVVVLGIVSADDLIDGQVTAGRVASHSLVVAGVALLYAVRSQVRRAPAPSPVTGHGLRIGDDRVHIGPPGPAAAALPQHSHSGVPRLPASRRRTA